MRKYYMNRIKTKFTELKTAKQKALIPYITAGDPNPKVTVDLMHALVTAGSDLIELGIPFSDPMADGPVIEAAHQRALNQKMTLTKVLDLVAEFRLKDQNTPVVLMGYLNPIENMGYAPFAELAANAGVDGVLIVDLPPEEARDWQKHLNEKQIDPIFLIAPTSDPERIKLICNTGSGYLYYVSLKGVTGSKTLDIDSVTESLAAIRNCTTLPIAVGFGIKDAQSATKVAKVADGVIVGSALVAKIAEFKDQPEKICHEVPKLIAEMRAAMNDGQ